MSEDAIQSDAVSPAVRCHIDHRLSEAAREAGVRILYAAESGSRAWGFASPDSDYDVRFIYAHPIDWYVQLAEPRDVIEGPLDAMLVDFAGWDVRKALRLLLRSNPALYEWLVSPIVYQDDNAFRPAAKALFERHASQRALAHHYFSIARGQWRREIEGQEQVKLKKYFYAVRPLLSLRWVIRHGTPPPMMLQDLVATVGLPQAPAAALIDLVILKRDTPELGRRPRLAVMDDWLLSEMDALNPEKHDLATERGPEARAAADALFRTTIGFAPGA